MKETTNLKANEVRVIFHNKDKEDIVFTNVTCTNGRNAMLSQLLSPTLNSGIKELALGTGTTTATESDTALETETDREAINFIQSELTGTSLVLYATFGTVGAITIEELGLFMGTSNDILLARSNSPTTITKPDGEAITVKWTLNLNNG